MSAATMDRSRRQLSAGFADPVHDAQSAFRACLAAFARPGRAFDVGQPIAGLGLGAAMAHILLALTDDGTPVWWQDGSAVHADWLRFHTGASVAGAAGDAMFGVVVVAAAMPPLEHFAPGTAASPEDSATLLVEVPSLDRGPDLQWSGPGLREATVVRVAGMSPAFWSQWQANHAAFPQGLDVLFTCGARVLGLPRTTRIGRLEGI